MASIKYSGVIDEIKGNINGTTFQGGKAGAVVKSKNRRSGGTKLTKADAGRVYNPRKKIAEIAGRWRNLPDEQRATWNTGAVDFPAVNKFGDVYTPSGYQVFMTLNSQINFAGTAYMDVCPVPATVASLPTITPSVFGSEALLLTLGAAVTSGNAMQIWATQRMAGGKQAPQGFYKLIGYGLNADGTVLDITDNWEDVFGSFILTGRIYFKMRMVNQLTGQTGVWYYTYLDLD